MYQVQNNMQYFYCTWNFHASRWEWTRRFENEKDLIKFIASGWSRLPFTDTRGYNTILDTLNYSGSDTYQNGWYDFVNHVWRHDARYFRDKAILNQYGQVIDARKYKQAALALLHEENAKRTYRWYRQTPPYEFRKDPVPFVHKRHYGRYCRRWRNWKHNLLTDSIPEYREYVRTKAIQPDKWDVEPFEETSKSWKHNTKCRHQWEIHLPRHKDREKERKHAMHASASDHDNTIIITDIIWDMADTSKTDLPSEVALSDEQGKYDSIDKIEEYLAATYEVCPKGFAITKVGT